MTRSRKSPPLFEVMGEALKARGDHPRLAPGQGAPPASAAPRPVMRVVEPERSVPERAYPRLPDAPRTNPQRPDEHTSPLTASGEWRIFGIPAQQALIGFSALLLVISLTAIVAFRLGKDQERRDLLGKEFQGPPPGISGNPMPAPIGNESPGPAMNTPGRKAGGTPAPLDQTPTPPRTTGGTPVPPPVPIGDDPRQPGSNYLVIESLTLKDAEPAAGFLAENGVPAAVVPPTGVDTGKLKQDPKGLWWVIARQGLTSEEYRSGDTRKGELIAQVKKIGRRWKQDHKGVSDFALPLWRLYGK